MIKTLVASTNEIDDIDLAIEELLKQLDLTNNLLNNSLGIITCRGEYLQTKLIETLSKNLPFDIVGTTTILGGTNKNCGPYIFSLFLITSDDTAFETVRIKDINVDNYEYKIKEAAPYLFDRTPVKMLFMFAPLLFNLSADRLINVIDGLTTNFIPIFGSVAISHNQDSSNSFTIFNKNYSEKDLILVSVYGNINPKFSVASIEEDHIKKERGLITNSLNNLVQEINGSQAVTYLENIGYGKDLIFDGLGVIPLVLNYPDIPTPITRSVFSIGKEGDIILGGDAPINIPVSIGYMNTKDVVDITHKELKKHILNTDYKGLMIYSCVARYYILGLTNTQEYDKCKEVLLDKNYLFAYAGGEICPIKDKNGNLKNFLHNHSIIMLGF